MTSSMRTNTPGGMAVGPGDARITDQKDGHPLSRDGAPNYPAPPDDKYAPDNYTGNTDSSDNRSVGDSPRGP
jgi:hypothetical protein